MIVVTLTSWTKRIHNVKKVVESIMNNTVQPDRVYLNLSETEFQGIQLPQDLIDYFDSDDRLILNWVHTLQKLSLHYKYVNIKHKNNEKGISYIEIS